jgi:hypothetical protein
LDGFILVIAYGAMLWLIVWFVIFLPARMAKKRNRSAVIWVLFSIILSPLVAVVLLLLLGKNQTYRNASS